MTIDGGLCMTSDGGAQHDLMGVQICTQVMAWLYSTPNRQLSGERNNTLACDVALFHSFAVQKSISFMLKQQHSAIRPWPFHHGAVICTVTSIIKRCQRQTIQLYNYTTPKSFRSGLGIKAPLAHSRWKFEVNTCP